MAVDLLAHIYIYIYDSCILERLDSNWKFSRDPWDVQLIDMFLPYGIVAVFLV